MGGQAAEGAAQVSPGTNRSVTIPGVLRAPCPLHPTELPRLSRPGDPLSEPTQIKPRWNFPTASEVKPAARGIQSNQQLQKQHRFKFIACEECQIAETRAPPAEVKDGKFLSINTLIISFFLKFKRKK